MTSISANSKFLKHRHNTETHLSITSSRNCLAYHALKDDPFQMNIQKDFLVNCCADHNQYDELLHDLEATCQVFVPSQSDVRKFYPSSLLGVLASRFSKQFFHSHELFLSWVSRASDLVQTLFFSNTPYCMSPSLPSSKFGKLAKVFFHHIGNMKHISNKTVVRLNEILFSFFRRIFHYSSDTRSYHDTQMRMIHRLA